MSHNFDVSQFLPYLLNQAAEQTSVGFQENYRERYGMLRTEWRVLFHLGKYGDMTATEIARLAMMHKTKISRAVSALEDKRFLRRNTKREDRRQETLCLTVAGSKAYQQLAQSAADYEAVLTANLSKAEIAMLKRVLKNLAMSSDVPR